MDTLWADQVFTVLPEDTCKTTARDTHNVVVVYHVVAQSLVVVSPRVDVVTITPRDVVTVENITITVVKNIK